jgi:large subunit ribosomal protein L7A
MDQFVDIPKVVGTKQTLKAVSEGKARKVYLAQDTEEHIKKMIYDCCQEHMVSIDCVDTKIQLGKAGGIERPAAVITIIK